MQVALTIFQIQPTFYICLVAIFTVESLIVLGEAECVNWRYTNSGKTQFARNRMDRFSLLLFMKGCNNKNIQKPFDFVRWLMGKTSTKNDATVKLNHQKVTLSIVRVCHISHRSTATALWNFYSVSHRSTLA